MHGEFQSSPTILARIVILLGSTGARSSRPPFCVCWRQSGGSRVPAAPVPWWRNPVPRQAPTAHPQSVPKRSPNLRPSDLCLVGLCALLMRPPVHPFRIVVKPSTLLSSASSADTTEVHGGCSHPMERRSRAPRDPAKTVVAAVVDMKQQPESGMSTDPANIARPSVFPSTRMSCGAFSRLGHHPKPTQRGRPGSRSWVTRRTACGVLICFGANRPPSPRTGCSSWWTNGRGASWLLASTAASSTAWRYARCSIERPVATRRRSTSARTMSAIPIPPMAGESANPRRESH